MILSMTGFGKAELQNDKYSISMEIRTVNSRFLDFSSKMPRTLLAFEDKAIKILKKEFIRGRIILSVKLNYSNLNNNNILDQNRLEEYLKAIKEIKSHFKIIDNISVGDILSLPDIFSNEELHNKDELKNDFICVLKNTIKETYTLRLEEGKNIQKDLELRLNQLSNIINKIEKIALKVHKNSFDKYKQKIEDILSGIETDESRIYQESAIIAEKKDITEEIVRFKSHIELFEKYMSSNNSEGKKMNFLLQEMSREVNTIGSKVDSIDISHLVVQLKDEIEKIREQVQNIV